MFEKLKDSPLAQLLRRNDWGEFASLMSQLSEWNNGPVFYSAFENLNRAALFTSAIHGTGHIERVMLLGAVIAMLEDESNENMNLLMDMCSYHDTGRVSDWLDEFHGSRSCYKLEELTGRAGEELKLTMAGVEAHSRKDDDMDSVIAKYEPADIARAKRLALLLKDADGLDRVRIGDLDPRFMRTDAAKTLTGFSEYLFKAYSAMQEEMGQEPVRRDMVDRKIMEQMRDHVQECYFGHDHNCAFTMLMALAQFFETDLSPQLLLASKGMHGAGKFGAQCGLVEGALMFLGVYYGGRGEDQYSVERICNAFAHAFTEKYKSLTCRDLRPGGFNDDDPPHLCAGLTLDAILFTREFILEQNNK